KKIQIWFVEEEIKAIDSGIIIDGFTDFLDFASKNGKNIAIASNNSIDCIGVFLGKLGSEANKKYQIPVIGRDAQHPERMKPSTYMLEKVCQTNNWSRRDTLYVGDHPRDYECAMNFGCRFIGMTPTSAKKERLTKYNTTIITVDDFFGFIKLLA
ncbi:MAG: HAD family hydrolase, partial [Clostridia bacterium]|nr:HAD family hydrolase [Clostridia bacterium]